MRLFLIIVLVFALSFPAAAYDDSVEKIVKDYKDIESLYKSGHISKKDYIDSLVDLQERAIRQSNSQCFKDKDDQVLCLEGEYWYPEYPLFLKILSGFQQEPS